MVRSVAARRSAPASEVTSPPSKSALSSRPPALPKIMRLALHCVGIGDDPPFRYNSFLHNKFYQFRDPGAPQPHEKSALVHIAWAASEKGTVHEVRPVSSAISM